MKIKGVVFDMDGLMLDSERLYEQATIEVVSGMGEKPSIELIRKTTGLPEVSWCAMVQEHYGPDFDIACFRRGCTEKMRVWYEEKSIPVKPGLFELLDYLKSSGILCGVASSTYREKAMKSLDRVGISPYMSGFMFGDMVENGKPAPDIFLAAADALGLAPDECMGLEDSYNGIRASSGAGLYTVIVPDLLLPTQEILALTKDCVETLADVIPIIESVNNPKGQ